MQPDNRATRVTLYDGLKGRSSSATIKALPIPSSRSPVLLEVAATVDISDPGTQAMRAALLARRRPLIEAALETIRANLRRDGGDCELIKLDGDAVYIRLSGTCVGCQLASITVGGVRQKLMEALGMPLRVIPVT